MQWLPRILAVVAIAMLAYACNSSGCLENRSSVPLAGFYSGDNRQITLDSVAVIGIGSTDTLYNTGTRLSSVYLPMRSTQNSTSWRFIYRWQYLAQYMLEDTITFDYESTPYFASSDCGVVYKYRITRLQHTTHLIDSIVLADSLITNIDTEQIKIYYRTAE